MSYINVPVIDNTIQLRSKDFDGHDIIIYRNEFAQEVATYDTYEETLTVWWNRPAIGLYKAVSLQEQGYADIKCRGCKYLTGESQMPCAVNPLSYKEGCIDYEI